MAAGAGTRLGRSGGGPKALVDVGGRPLVAHALDRVAQLKVDEIVVVHPPDTDQDFQAVVTGPVRLVPGGATRSDSVRAGVAALDADHDVIAIHDAARAFMPPGVMQAALDVVRGPVVAAAPVLPVADTLKEVDQGRVVATVDRSRLWAVQTPQVVARLAWDKVVAWSDGGSTTDDLALIEQARAAGAVEGEIRVVAGSRFGWKITWPEDLELAAALAQAETSGARPVELPW